MLRDCLAGRTGGHPKLWFQANGRVGSLSATWLSDGGIISRFRPFIVDCWRWRVIGELQVLASVVSRAAALFCSHMLGVVAAPRAWSSSVFRDFKPGLSGHRQRVRGGGHEGI